MNMMANEFLDRNYDVKIVTINQADDDFIKIRAPHNPLNRRKENFLIDTIKAFLNYQNILRDFKPNFIIVNCDLPELFALLTFTREQQIIVEHANPAWSTRRLIGLIVRTLLILKGSKFVAVSEHLSIWPFMRKPDRIILNPIPSDLKLPKINKYEQKPIERVVFIGRLANPQKRPQVLLDIAKATGLKILFIGDGYERKSLAKIANRESLQIEFAQFCENPWLLLCESDLLIVPSLFEGDGLVVIEALLAEIPFLLSDIPDFRRFNFPDYFYCLSINDYVRKILENPNSNQVQRIPDELRNKVLEARQIEKVGNSWEEYFNSLNRSIQPH